MCRFLVKSVTHKKAFQCHETQFLLYFPLKKKSVETFSIQQPQIPNFVHFHQKVDIKSVLESCGTLRAAFIHAAEFLSAHNAMLINNFIKKKKKSFFLAYKREVTKHMNFCKSSNKNFVKLTQ